MKILKKLKISLEIRRREKLNKRYSKAWKVLHHALDIIGSEHYMNTHFTEEVREKLDNCKVSMDILFDKQLANIAELYKLDGELKNV